MKNILLIVFICNLSVAWGTCIPGFAEEAAFLDVDPALETTAEVFQGKVFPLIPKDISLALKFDSLNPRINAEAKKNGSAVEINVMGGMLSQPEMNPDTLLLLLCHELGHVLGGPPLKSRGGWSSTEGQADFYSANKCIRHLGLDEVRFLDASLKLTAIYARVNSEAAPELMTCDPKVVDRTNFGYPGLQCRLDTLMAGWRNEKRPACWYSEN